jgi:hypothetical protein
MLVEILPIENGRYSTKDRYHIFEFLIPTSVLHLHDVFRIIIANTFKVLALCHIYVKHSYRHDPYSILTITLVLWFPYFGWRK